MVEKGNRQAADKEVADRWRKAWIKHQRERFRRQLAMCVMALDMNKKRG